MLCNPSPAAFINSGITQYTPVPISACPDLHLSINLSLAKMYINDLYNDRISDGAYIGSFNVIKPDGYILVGGCNVKRWQYNLVEAMEKAHAYSLQIENVKRTK